MNVEDLSRPLAAQRTLLRNGAKYPPVQVRQRNEPFRMAQGGIEAAFGSPRADYFPGPVGPARCTF